MKLTCTDTEIIVTELRPMNQVPRSGNSFLAFHRDFPLPLESFVSVEGHLVCIQFQKVIEPEYFIGWIPMPVYRP